MSEQIKQGAAQHHFGAIDSVDPEMQEAFRLLEMMTPQPVFPHLRHRIMRAAVPKLRALCRPRERTLLEYTAGWARPALPLAMAASLLLGVILVRSPSGSTANTSPTGVSATQTDIRMVLYSVLTKSVGVDEAARTLASDGGNESRLWEEVVQ